ncbi:MAG: OmpA family protein [Deltaproteobacteria bacterium]|nr:OmpA family protein [Deltaproteobacteria bacterium]
MDAPQKPVATGPSGRSRNPIALDGDDGRASQDLWLISYADLMTLLLAFFVMILAISSVREDKFEKLKREVNPKAAAPLSDAQGTVDKLIEGKGLAAVARTVLSESGLSIQLDKSILFASARADVVAAGRAILEPIAKVLVGLGAGYEVVVEGHTDDIPMRGGGFRSNWELSTQRAVEVLRVLAESGVSADRLSAQGFAETRPLVPAVGTSEEIARARAKNRRVELRVRSVDAASRIKPSDEKARRGGL